MREKKRELLQRREPPSRRFCESCSSSAAVAGVQLAECVARTAEVGLRELVLLDGGTHRAIDDHDTLLHLILDVRSDLFRVLLAICTSPRQIGPRADDLRRLQRSNLRRLALGERLLAQAELRRQLVNDTLQLLDAQIIIDDRLLLALDFRLDGGLNRFGIQRHF